MNNSIIHSVFEETADRFPGNIAIDDGSRSITYRELNASANRMAHALTEVGVTGQSIIGIYSDASIEYVAAVLGVLKAGAIFMPLNVQFPEKRLANIMERTKPRLLFTDALLEDSLHTRLLELDLSFRPDYLIISDNASNFKLKKFSDGTAMTGKHEFPDKNPPLVIGADDGCYLVTTSGSTGEPKAILGSQKGLSHFIHWEIGEFSLNQDVRVSLLSAVTFDVSLRDIFVPLITGGTLCVPDDETRHNPKRLLRWLRDNRITLMHIVPTLFRLLTREIEETVGDTNALPDLQYVLTAGEPLYGSDVINWRQACGSNMKLVNLYGPSETTLAKLFYIIGDNDFAPGEIVPIGKPIPDTEVLVIKDDRPCQVDETGEIHIKTPFMTKGYYNATRLNEESFIQNPLIKDHQEIIYKTGDQGKWMPDGNLRFEGRLDGQVKIYGNRVEIGEIEVALRQHPQVGEAAVSVRQDGFGNMRLAGYIVPQASQKPVVESLRRFLADRLPDYMLPAVFVTLKEMPLTHNGKIDRGALPEPDGARPEMEQPYVSPITNQERVLAGIWSRVLGIEEVGIQDNFFDLGGTSILAVRLVGLMQELLQIEMPVVTLFQYPNIKAMAKYLIQKQSDKSSFLDVRKRAQQRRASFSNKRLSSRGS